MSVRRPDARAILDSLLERLEASGHPMTDNVPGLSWVNSDGMNAWVIGMFVDEGVPGTMFKRVAFSTALGGVVLTDGPGLTWVESGASMVWMEAHPDFEYAFESFLQHGKARDQVRLYAVGSGPSKDWFEEKKE